MKRKVLIVIDMQNDFCKSGGVLYSPDAEAIIPNIVERCKEYNKVETTWYCLGFDETDVKCAVETLDDRYLYDNLYDAKRQYEWKKECLDPRYKLYEVKFTAEVKQISKERKKEDDKKHING